MAEIEASAWQPNYAEKLHPLSVVLPDEIKSIIIKDISILLTYRELYYILSERTSGIVNLLLICDSQYVSKGMCIVEYAQPTDASTAFEQLANKEWLSRFLSRHYEVLYADPFVDYRLLCSKHTKVVKLNLYAYQHTSIDAIKNAFQVFGPLSMIRVKLSSVYIVYTNCSDCMNLLNHTSAIMIANRAYSLKAARIVSQKGSLKNNILVANLSLLDIQNLEALIQHKAMGFEKIINRAHSILKKKKEMEMKIQEQQSLLAKRKAIQTPDQLNAQSNPFKKVEETSPYSFPQQMPFLGRYAQPQYFIFNRKLIN